MKRLHSTYRRLLAAFFLLAVTLVFVPALMVVTTFPQEVRILRGEDFTLDVGPWFSLVASKDDGLELHDRLKSHDGLESHDRLESYELDSYEVELRLFGRVPLKKAAVNVVPEMHVIPGGQAVGILTTSSGLLVVRTSSLPVGGGASRSPAAEAGIRPGDIIVRVGDTPVHHPLDIESAADWYGKRGRPIPVLIKREGKELQLAVTPVAVPQGVGRGDRYMMGVYLKDPAAGVGTLTFWDPISRQYGALGHQISDDGEALPLTDGKIVPALIHGIQPGAKGRPGEKMGIFEQGPAMGSIEKNTPFGIFGRLVREPEAAMKPIPVALNQEVKVGDAEILTVLDGSGVESFRVEVTAVYAQAKPSGKGLVIKVTDPRLLARTSGIVQGMSGSPIIQDGKLIGAVTHVFVNDPTRGFGVLAEWMVYEAGIAINSRDESVAGVAI